MEVNNCVTHESETASIDQSDNVSGKGWGPPFVEIEQATASVLPRLDFGYYCLTAGGALFS